MLRTVLIAVIAVALAIVIARLMSRGSATPVSGSLAPDFTLPSQDGAVSLHDYRGKWVVLYFYPKDQTPG